MSSPLGPISSRNERIIGVMELRTNMTLSVANARFSYGRKLVISDLSVLFAPGRTVLLGPNGAGKSTLMAMLASVLRPRGGSIRLQLPEGSEPTYGRRSYRSRIAWLPQNITPMPGLTVREHVAYSGWLKGMRRSDAWRASERDLIRFDLSALAGSKATQLSGGQTRRMALAGSLVHDADVILLDEPTAGLDPNQRDHFRKVLADLPSDVITVVSTHQTEDLIESYNQAIVLVDGSIRFQGPVRALVGEQPSADATAIAYRRLVGAEL